MLAEHGELAGIDAGRAIFAGLIDAQHGRDVGGSVTRTPGGRCFAHAAFGLRRLSHRIAAAERVETIAFQPAMEMPSHDH